MSQVRKIRLMIDTDRARKVCDANGWSYREREVINSFATRGLGKADLVIEVDGVEFGIMDGELVYDDMYADAVSRFVRAYLEDLFSERGLSYDVQETRDRLVITVF